MIEPTHVQELINRWWFAYDQADFEQLGELLTTDTRFVCRTDTGQTDFEEFVRADVSGRDDVMAWQTPHRTGSPDPLRHHGTNIHITSQNADEADFASYIFVSHIVGLEPAESEALLAYLSSRARIPEYQCRFRWTADAVAFWDNRVTQHYAVSDYAPARRVMERATVIGDRPY